jgi:hypothetical protein
MESPRPWGRSPGVDGSDDTQSEARAQQTSGSSSRSSSSRIGERRERPTEAGHPPRTPVPLISLLALGPLA